MTKAVYAGTFDPPTLGHLDVIRRGRQIFEHLTVAVAENPSKQPLFSAAERVEMLRAMARDLRNVTVDAFRGLAVEYVRSLGAEVMLRGVRTMADFEYEFQMALTNRAMAPGIETVYVMTHQEVAHVSSHLVKEIHHFGGDVAAFVHPSVDEAFQKRQQR